MLIDNVFAFMRICLKFLLLFHIVHLKPSLIPVLGRLRRRIVLNLRVRVTVKVRPELHSETLLKKTKIN